MPVVPLVAPARVISLPLLLGEHGLVVVLLVESGTCASWLRGGVARGREDREGRKRVRKMLMDARKTYKQGRCGFALVQGRLTAHGNAERAHGRPSTTRSREGAWVVSRALAPVDTLHTDSPSECTCHWQGSSGQMSANFADGHRSVPGPPKIACECDKPRITFRMGSRREMACGKEIIRGVVPCA